MLTFYFAARPPENKVIPIGKILIFYFLIRKMEWISPKPKFLFFGGKHPGSPTGFIFNFVT